MNSMRGEFVAAGKVLELFDELVLNASPDEQGVGRAALRAAWVVVNAGGNGTGHGADPKAFVGPGGTCTAYARDRVAK